MPPFDTSIRDRAIKERREQLEKDRRRLIYVVARVLKEGGKAVISDWKKENTSLGPPISIRVSKEQAIDMFREVFNPLKEKNLLYHYLLTFQKK